MAQPWLYETLTTGLDEEELADVRESMNLALQEQLAEAAAAAPPRRRRPSPRRSSDDTSINSASTTSAGARHS